MGRYEDIDPQTRELLNAAGWPPKIVTKEGDELRGIQPEFRTRTYDDMIATAGGVTLQNVPEESEALAN